MRKGGKAETGGERKRRKSGTTLRQEGWHEAFPEEAKRWALDHGLPQIVIEKEAEAFVEYWANGNGRGRRMKNWMATWRNWVRKNRHYTPEAVAHEREARLDAMTDRLMQVVRERERRMKNGKKV